MPGENNLQAKADFYKPLSIDFAEQFNKNLTSFYQLIGVERLMPMNAGAVIKTYKSQVTLAGGAVDPGDIIPLSKVNFTEADTYELVWDKRRKAAPVELIQQVGYDRAMVQTDQKFIRELQKGVRTKMIEQLATGKGKATGTNLQSTLANNWAKVVSTFAEDDVSVISFINPQDAADYLGKANITIQTTFGMNYMQNFLNNTVVFMHPDVKAGTVYSTAAQNLVLAYANVNGEINKAFDFVTDESGFIGVTHDVNKTRLTAETVTLSGIVLYAEILDGVVIGTIKPEVGV